MRQRRSGKARRSPRPGGSARRSAACAAAAIQRPADPWQTAPWRQDAAQAETVNVQRYSAAGKRGRGRAVQSPVLPADCPA